MEELSGTLRISGLEPESVVDGPGVRFVVFTQGCPHRCPGCHNPETHDPAGGRDMALQDIFDLAQKDKLVSGITFSGGEPVAQAERLVPLARAFREAGKHLMIYSGYTFEELLAMEDPAVRQLLELCDVLVDGRFILEERSLELRFRGSRNQRVIDLPASLEKGQAVESPYAHR